jgi:hypothetical protein
VKFERADALRTYDEVSGKLNPRGQLPARAMPFFWQVAIMAGDAPEVWPETRFLDRRFIDSYDAWAPK